MSAYRKILAFAATLMTSLLVACTGTQAAHEISGDAQSASSASPAAVNGFPASDLSGYAAFEGYDGPLQFYDVTVKDIEELVADDETFVFVAAFDKCPWCNLCIAQLNEVALAEDVQVGYLDTRLDPSWQSNTDIDDYDVFVELFGSHLKDDDEGMPHLYTPHVFFIKDGAVVAEHSGAVDDAEDPTQPLTEEQSQALEDIYREGFSSIR